MDSSPSQCSCRKDGEKEGQKRIRAVKEWNRGERERDGPRERLITSGLDTSWHPSVILQWHPSAVMSSKSGALSKSYTYTLTLLGMAVFLCSPGLPVTDKWKRSDFEGFRLNMMSFSAGRLDAVTDEQSRKLPCICCSVGRNFSHLWLSALGGVLCVWSKRSGFLFLWLASPLKPCWDCRCCNCRILLQKSNLFYSRNSFESIQSKILS